jgi:uncharacterized repeat protein (TIGR03803 family)
MNRWSFLSLIFRACVFGALVVLGSPAKALASPIIFNNPQTNTLVQGFNGNFYGTTTDGGKFGSGTVFEITPRGKLTTLYSFCSEASCADGSYPAAGLLQAANGMFYGTTCYGGTGPAADVSYDNEAPGRGTLFEISSAGRLKTLHNFCTEPGDKSSEQDGLYCGDGS